MKAMIAIACLFALTGCVDSSGRVEGYDGLRKTRIEGCQYLTYRGGGASGIAHAGNCDNPIHNCPCDTLKP